MNLAIVGSRTFGNYTLLSESIKNLQDFDLIENIITGGAKGADSLAARFAAGHSIECIELLPDWRHYGRGAGLVRNKQIISLCDLCIAFWDGQSKGTKADIALCEKMGKPCLVVSF